MTYTGADADRSSTLTIQPRPSHILGGAIKLMSTGGIRATNLTSFDDQERKGRGNRDSSVKMQGVDPPRRALQHHKLLGLGTLHHSDTVHYHFQFYAQT